MRCEKFNTGWSFEKITADSQLKAFQGKKTTTDITLPYDAMIREKREKNCPSGAQSGFYPGGCYAYEKKFFVPEEWENQDVVLEFEGIYGVARIWVNGSLAVTNHNGYMGFGVDLNPWFLYGDENVVRVEVDNSRQPNSRWYTGSGIYRDVNLLLGKGVYVPRDHTRITTLSVDNDIAVIEICAEMKNRTGHGVEAECEIEICYHGETVAGEKQKVVFRSNPVEIMRVRIPILSPQKWSPEHPDLYECRIRTSIGEELCDCISETFGIRVLSMDALHGFRINGVTVNLRGACIHHDNGIIGAETFPEAEWYRCRRLKEAGFNAIRSAHHPISRAMLDACDRLGMLVMDELTDVWNRHKNPYDDADFFQDEAGEWITHMVSKDYNHPSVIFYCVGNEIQEAGTKQGSWINRFLCNKIHELDSTRYTTNALNGLNCAGKRLKVIMKEVVEHFGMETAGTGNGGGSNVLNSFMSLMQGEKGAFFASHPLVTEALEECSQSCDVTGLNYLGNRYLLEHELHPGKPVVGTETYPAEIENLWALVEENPHVIGDFTWAGYDYIGEAGVGIFHYDGEVNFSSVWPERLGYIGDIDLIGNRRPVSYYREIVYGLTDRPYIAVERMEHTGQTPSKTAWMFKDNISSWTWNGWEGKAASVDVYSSADEIELFLNGMSLGRKPAGKKHHFTATYQVTYQPGILKAVAYRGGEYVGEYTLTSAEEATELRAEQVTEDEENLVYVKAWLTDRQGKLNPQAKKKIHVEVTGNGKLEGFGTANPSNEEDYFSEAITAYDGYVMAAIRRLNSIEKEPAYIRFSAEDCGEIMVKIGGNKNGEN